MLNSTRKENVYMFRPEYPRPSFVRNNWLNLNGEWQFEICDNSESYIDKKLSRTIEVPFCPESVLSNVGYTDFMNHVWYRRQIQINAEKLQGRVLLHFGAVDYLSKVYINGKNVGAHKGGYVGFCFDISDYLNVGENTIDLSVFDDTRSYSIPSGKQSTKRNSYGCYYTRTTGIWQTVWLEFTSTNYIKSCHIIADVDSKTISFKGCVCSATSISVNVELCGTKVASGIYSIDKNFDVSINISDIVLWGVFSPNLYDITLNLVDNDTIIDEVTTYTAFRKITILANKIFLNDKPLFLTQVLDQGFYPEGIYTAKCVEDIYQDIDISIEFGFNGSRPHEKIMEEHYLYYADKKGFLLWGEFPNWNCIFTQKNSDGYENFMTEWEEVVIRDYNHPSIIGWCPLNEAWPLTKNKCDKTSQVNLYNLTKTLDPTRPVIGASGGTIYTGDFCDFHTYTHNVAKLALIIDKVDCNVFSKTGRIGGRLSGKLMPRKNLLKLPKYLSEFGGITYQNGNDNWGYNTAVKSEKEFVKLYSDLTATVRDSDAVGLCYTQLTDVEQEQNGLVKYDRSHKFSPEAISEIYKITSSCWKK